MTRQLFRTAEDVSSRRGNHPLVDYYYRTPHEEPRLHAGGVSHAPAKPETEAKFSDLSRSVFGIEGSQNSVVETIVYSLVAGIAALPIAIAIYVMYQTI